MFIFLLGYQQPVGGYALVAHGVVHSILRLEVGRNGGRIDWNIPLPQWARGNPY